MGTCLYTNILKDSREVLRTEGKFLRDFANVNECFTVSTLYLIAIIAEIQENVCTSYFIASLLA